MVCPKCKNPIEDRDVECEWCGASTASQSAANNQNTFKPQVNDLDTELLNILWAYPTPLQLKQTEALCRAKTGLSSRYAKDYINRLWHMNFSVQSMKLKKRAKRRYNIILLIYFLIPLFWLPLIIGLCLYNRNVRYRSSIFWRPNLKYFSKEMLK